MKYFTKLDKLYLEKELKKLFKLIDKQSELIIVDNLLDINNRDKYFENILN